MKVLKFYSYRQAIGGGIGTQVPGNLAPIVLEGLRSAAEAAGHPRQSVRDNHTLFIVSVTDPDPGRVDMSGEYAYYWSDGSLRSVTRVVAGDCNPEATCLTELWSKPE